MLQEGLEPPCLTTTDPKSVASANFATRAKNMEVRRIELLTQLCKSHVLPLAPHPPKRTHSCYNFQ